MTRWRINQHLPKCLSNKEIFPRHPENSRNSQLYPHNRFNFTAFDIFDAVAVVLSDSGAQALFSEGAAIDFVRDAFGHLKAIAIDKGGQALLQKAGVTPDAGVVSAADVGAFITAAKTRQWAREAAVRTLA